MRNLAIISALAASIAAQSSSDATATSTAAGAEYTPTGKEISESQLWHDRYHGILAMAAYGDYATECPKFFTNAELQKNFPGSTEAPWTVLQQFGPGPEYGVTGFSAIIPEMNKVVLIFAGVTGWENFNSTPVPLPLAYGGDTNGTRRVHAGALAAYNEVKQQMDGFAAVIAAIASTGHIFSISGHAFGGMVAQVAAMDLGWNGHGQALHTFGSPPALSPEAVVLYNKLYAGDSSFRTVANEDSVPGEIPESSDYEHILSGWHVYGTNSTFGQNYYISRQPHDPQTLGGNVASDNMFYYTLLGSCAQNRAVQTYNTTANEAALSSLIAAYSATATAPIGTPTWNATSTSVSSSMVATSTSEASSAAASATTAEDLPANSNDNKDSGASTMAISVMMALVGLGAAMVL